MASQEQVLDICEGYRKDVCDQIFRILGRGKELRAWASGLGIVTSTSPVAAGPAMASVNFPLGGELSHITSSQQIVRVILALESLETALATPVDGIVPIAAFSSFR